jgi:hypothetical protein
MSRSGAECARYRARTIPGQQGSAAAHPMQEQRTAGRRITGRLMALVQVGIGALFDHDADRLVGAHFHPEPTTYGSCR